MDNESRPRITVTDPASLLASIPYLIGFHPADSLVILLIRDSRLVVAIRIDLPDVDTPADAAPLAHTIAAWCTEADSGINAAEIVGYGPQPVAALAAAASSVLPAVGVQLRHVLQVDGHRYRPVKCPDGCGCPSGGGVFDPAGSVAAAQATYAGLVALPDRDTVAAQVAPVTGAARQAMRQATDTARTRLETLLAGGDHGQRGRQHAHARLVQEGTAAVDDAVNQPAPLSDAQAAWLSVLLAATAVRDHALLRTTGGHAQVQLWADLTRRAEPDLVAAPACLCAYAAWRTGNGVLARFAVHRALAANPTYRMAQLLDQLLDLPIPPHRFDAWTGQPPTPPANPPEPGQDNQATP